MKEKTIVHIRQITERLVGASEAFSIEARIFHAACLVSILCTLVDIPMNFAVGVPVLALAMIALLAAQSFIYYCARVRKKLSTGVFLFGLFGSIFFVFNYCQNSGINGPTLLIFLLFLFLVIAVSPKTQFRLWIPLNIALVGALLFLQYRFPNIAPYNYPHTSDRYLDFAYSYLAIAMMTLWLMLYIRNSYNRQRLSLVKKAEELEIANETRNKLLSIVAHDLRAPLASIQSYLEMLTEYDMSADTKRDMEQELLKKTKNTGQMLANLLLWTQNQLDGVVANLAELNVAATLEPIIVIERAIANEKCITLHNELGSDAWIRADSNMFQLVVRNLLNNAIKFTPSGGEITLASELRESRWRILVKDTGTGIPDERKAAIFSIRNQSTYGTRNEKGTGLGLLLCKEFTDLQHGEIGFESVAGEGTTFYIDMPACRLPTGVAYAEQKGIAVAGQSAR
ncbi:MAG: HAMP domain-containing histidine kinase [Bacteroidetes bacterium]|nr:HAMP domain-containing histidine kinase [Bacteroidota bacterium]